jgi:uncharacterized protein DUF6152
MKKRIGSFVVAFGLLTFCSSVFAHHGTGLYYGKDPVTLKGTVTEFEWANPHVQVYFDVKDDKGAVVHWACETLSPGKLARNGWSREALKPGDAITITLLPSRSGAPVGNLVKVVLPNGTVLGSRDDAPGGGSGSGSPQY